MVQYQPIPEDDVMMKKATKDTAGWVRSVAQERGRNADWVEKAVKESESITAQEALKLKVIDGIADDFDDLLKWMDGKSVQLSKAQTVMIKSKDAEVEELTMNLGQTLQHLINNPNVILVLLLLGGLGIALEFKAPGMIFPGVIGAALVLIALIAPTLDVNYIGLVLIILGIGCLIAEIFITSYGFLSIAGLAFLTYGSLMLFETERSWNVRVSWSILIPIIVFVATVLLVVGERILRAHRTQVKTGGEEMIGMEGEASTDLNPRGKVFVHGEWWNAESVNGEIKKGEQVVVVGMEKFTLRVKKK
jgi:membrane-bound serine protease (ClpP class)